jgi:hypothetical protein
MIYEPFSLVELSRGEDVWRLTDASHDVTWDGHAWLVRDDEIGIIKSVENWEEKPDAVSARDLIFVGGAWLHGELVADNSAFDVAIRAARRLTGGVLSVFPTVWYGKLSLVSSMARVDDPVTIEFAGQTAFDALTNAIATYSRGYRSTLVSGTDTAFDRSGGVIETDNGGVPGSAGPFINTGDMWDYGADRWQR